MYNNIKKNKNKNLQNTWIFKWKLLINKCKSLNYSNNEMIKLKQKKIHCENLHYLLLSL